jgi:hypothetical protein
MKKLTSSLLAAMLFLLPFWSVCQTRNATGAPQHRPGNAQELSKGFANPTGTARPKVYWWWLNGYTDQVRLKEELVAIKNAGLGGVDIFEIGFRPDGLVPAGPAFMGDSSLKTIAFAIKEASKLGLEVGLNLSSSWNAGGTWIKPEHGAKSLYFSKISFDKAKNGGKLPFPEIPKKDKSGKDREWAFAPDGKPFYRKDIAVLAIPSRKAGSFLDTTNIVNVTRHFDPKTEILKWDAPAGDWEIYRYVCVSSGELLKLPSPNSQGLIIDHFDSTATRIHFEYFINKLKPLLGDFRKTGFKNLYLASFEATGTIWTPTLATEFRKLNGYDVSKFLPALFDKNVFNPAQSAQFKQDFDLTISELMINNHYRKGREIANRHGLNLISESGGPGPPLHNVPVESIKALGALDVPRGEFWINHSRYDAAPDSIDLLMLVKEIAAASHIYQRKITELEAFTSFQNWWEGPGDMKPIGDRAFCEGMNRPVIHGFTHNPRGVGYPGIYYAAGTHFNDKTTWWPKIKPFNDYLSRVSYILQETDFVADVLYYYGDKVPNFVTPKNTRFAVGSGYDYEIINTEILLRDLTVKNGLLTLPYGAQFKVLALDEISGKNPAILKKIEELRQAGAVITSAMPARRIGEMLKSKGVGPDFDYPDKNSARLDYMHTDQPLLDFIHHKKADQDFYFIRNTSNETVTRICSFRQTGKTPQLWDPMTGNIIPIPVFSQAQSHMEVPVSLPPYASVFIVFTNDKRQANYTSLASALPSFEYSKNGILLSEKGELTLTKNGRNLTIDNLPKQQTITGAWDISFTKNWGAPDKATFPELISWTKSSNEGIRHYSGSVMYSKTFETNITAGNNNRIFLDLGDVSKVCEVWLNGKSLGIAWTKPYHFDVTGILQAGKNDLRIEVINTWANRIIGDITSEKKYTKTNLNVRGSRELLWTETPLVPSGILGPVVIKTVTIIK